MSDLLHGSSRRPCVILEFFNRERGRKRGRLCLSIRESNVPRPSSLAVGPRSCLLWPLGVYPLTSCWTFQVLGTFRVGPTLKPTLCQPLVSPEFSPTPEAIKIVLRFSDTKTDPDVFCLWVFRPGPEKVGVR